MKCAPGEHLRLNAHRRSKLHMDGVEAYLVLPSFNNRTLEFAKELAVSMV
ncbi:MAG: hypothetical protein WKF84_18820 [Pyrinomonadaceae bacterium]